MSCSVPFLSNWYHARGYKPACVKHDEKYEEAKSYTHKLKSDFEMLPDMLEENNSWYTYLIAPFTVFVLTFQPSSYYLYFKNKKNRTGKVLSYFYLVLSIYSTYQLWEYLK